MPKKQVIRLTKLQKKHLPTIEWLISDDMKDRASGRSYLLAVAFVKKAVETGRRVEVFDHFSPDLRSRRNILDLIARMGIDGLEISPLTMSIEARYSPQKTNKKVKSHAKRK